MIHVDGFRMESSSTNNIDLSEWHIGHDEVLAKLYLVLHSIHRKFGFSTNSFRNTSLLVLSFSLIAARKFPFEL